MHRVEGTANPPSECRLLGIATGIVVAWAAWRASASLSPPSLWLDDAWVAALAKSPDFGLSLVQPASAPAGFIFIEGLAIRLLPDPVLAAQLWPFACGLAATPLAALLTLRLTHSLFAALMAAVLVAADPILLVYMTRAKPFSADVAFSLGQGLALHALLSGASRARLARFVAVCLASFLFSSVSVVVAGAATFVGGIVLWQRGVPRVELLAAGGVLLAAALSFAGWVYSVPRYGLLQDYWAPHFLVGADFTTIVQTVGAWLSLWAHRIGHAGVIHSGPLPAAEWGYGLLAVAGATRLAMRGALPQLGIGVLVVIAAILGAVLGVLPIGAVRTDTYQLPFVAILVASSLAWLDSVDQRGARLGFGAVVLLLAVVQSVSTRENSYPMEVASEAIAWLEAELEPEDGVWVNQLGTYSLAAHGRWPVRYVRNENIPISHPELLRAHFAVLNPDGERVSLPVDRPERVFLFLCHFQRELRMDMRRALRRVGYASVRAESWSGCSLSLHVRGARS